MEFLIKNKTLAITSKLHLMRFSLASSQVQSQTIFHGKQGCWYGAGMAFCEFFISQLNPKLFIQFIEDRWSKKVQKKHRNRSLEIYFLLFHAEINKPCICNAFQGIRESFIPADSQIYTSQVCKNSSQTRINALLKELRTRP